MQSSHLQDIPNILGDLQDLGVDNIQLIDQLFSVYQSMDCKPNEIRV